MERQELGDALEGTRVKLGEYLSLGEEEQWLWILDQLQRSDGVRSALELVSSSRY